MGQEPSTWPANNCLQIAVRSCVILSKCVFLQVIFCSCLTVTTLVWKMLSESNLNNMKIVSDQTIAHGYHKILWLFRSIICLSFQLQLIIDRPTTDKSEYFAQPHPIMITLSVSVGTTVKVHVVDLENERVAPYVNVRPLLSSTIKDLKALIHEVRKLLFATGWTGFKMFQFDESYGQVF